METPWCFRDVQRWFVTAGLCVATAGFLSTPLVLLLRSQLRAPPKEKLSPAQYGTEKHGSFLDIRFNVPQKVEPLQWLETDLYLGAAMPAALCIS